MHRVRQLSMAKTIRSRSGRRSSATGAASTSTCPTPTTTGRRRYPVVYMQDGQNLSDPAIAFAGQTWHLDEGLPWLAERGIEPIVVGTPQHRPSGSPNTVRSPTRRHGGGDGDRYARFLIDTVKPRIDGELPHAARPRQHRRRRLVDGRADQPLPLLPAAVAVRRRRGHESVDLVRRPRDPLVRAARAGRRAGASISTSARRRGPARCATRARCNRLLRRKGYQRDALRYVEAEGHQHREADWAWRLPQALEFLLRER